MAHEEGRRMNAEGRMGDDERRRMNAEGRMGDDERRRRVRRLCGRGCGFGASHFRTLHLARDTCYLALDT
ncbi:MAG TPA: hypothetical protein ENJ02_04125 [Chloroflexi bacterium]|nr:hypothetical protein [Chloroflexota bacterium]